MKKLGLIEPNFPNTQSSSNINSVNTTNQHGNNLAECGCPRRSDCPPIPDKLPFPATPEYREQIEQWIKQYFASSAFNVCPHQPLHAMSGEPVSITFNDDYTPIAIHKPIPVPHHWKLAVKSQLDRDVSLGIIEPVPTGTPTTWCSRMVTVPKPDGTPRRTVDLQNLNDATKRETHHTESPFHVVNTIPTNMLKSKLDAWNGYHSIPLADSARDATTFITEWGRYRYLRAPQGFHASNDAYTKRFDDITVGYPRVKRIVDDSILWNNDIASSFWHIVRYIKLCADHGVVFNPDKFQFAMEIIEFASFTITLDGYKPSVKLMNAIRNFPSPKNITGIRSWFGLINQTSYAFATAPKMAPFRELLKRNGKFYWDDTLEVLFQESKTEIIRCLEEGVKTFKINRPTCLTTDWSKEGTGFTLLQKHCTCQTTHPLCGSGHWKTTFAGSRFTTPAQSRYAPIEGEALALLQALGSCRMFVMGCPDLLVAVDHQPLTRIFNNRDLNEISNPRLLKMKEKTLLYRFRIMSIPGIKNEGANAMSRLPLDTSNNAEFDDTDIEPAVISSIQLNASSTMSTHTISTEAIKDPTYQELLNLIENGFPDQKYQLPEYLREYWNIRNELYTCQGLIYSEGRILIPLSLRRQMLDELHVGHHGANSMRANAQRRFFWPRLGAQIQNRRDQCRRCNDIAPSNRSDSPEELYIPSYPFQQTVTDLFHMAGQLFIIYADRFSGWTEVASTNPNSSAKTIMSIFRRYFANFGVPEQIASDGGPPFESYDLKDFFYSWNIHHRKSSVANPQSNGRAEAAVKTMKRILTTNVSPSGTLDTDEVVKALLLHRNTPVADMGLSPAELLFGRPINDHLPRPTQYRQQWQTHAQIRENAAHKRYNSYITRQQTTPPQPLKVGDSVAIQNQTGNHPLKWQKTGIIAEARPHKQYTVVVDGSRKATLRNRKFLRKIAPMTRDIYSDISDLPSKDHQPITHAQTLDDQTELSTAPPTPAKLPLPHAPPSDGKTNDQAALPRRSTRVKNMPERYGVYVSH